MAGIGKTNIFKDALLSTDAVDIFIASLPDMVKLQKVGEQLILQLYNAPKKITLLNELRYHTYRKLSRKKCAVQVKRLPTPQAAATQHILRVYQSMRPDSGVDG